MQLSITLEPGWCWILRTRIWQQLPSWRCLKAFGILNMFHRSHYHTGCCSCLEWWSHDWNFCHGFDGYQCDACPGKYLRLGAISCLWQDPLGWKCWNKCCRPSESSKWLIGSQRLTATPLPGWSWTPSRATSTCREPGSPTQPGEQVAFTSGNQVHNLSSPQTQCVHSSIPWSQHPARRKGICSWYPNSSPYANITVQRVFFRKTYLWYVGRSCSDISVCFNSNSFSQGYIVVSNVLQS